MNTLFRICLVMCLGLLVFNFAISYLEGTGAFEVSGKSGKDLGNTSTVLGDVTSLDTSNMNWIWGFVAGSILLGGIASYLAHSIIPIGISIFGSVFWASFINTWGVLESGAYVPTEFLTIFFVVSIFIFIGACVGMITGSG